MAAVRPLSCASSTNSGTALSGRSYSSCSTRSTRVCKRSWPLAICQHREERVSTTNKHAFTCQRCRSLRETIQSPRFCLCWTESLSSSKRRRVWCRSLPQSPWQLTRSLPRSTGGQSPVYIRILMGRSPPPMRRLSPRHSTVASPSGLNRQNPRRPGALQQRCVPQTGRARSPTFPAQAARTCCQGPYRALTCESRFGCGGQ
jgi:hypothetical protein